LALYDPARFVDAGEENRSTPSVEGFLWTCLYLTYWLLCIAVPDVGLTEGLVLASFLSLQVLSSAARNGRRSFTTRDTGPRRIDGSSGGGAGAVPLRASPESVVRYCG
jgi:hypothetical protein